jgi:hypothetical protein
LPVHAITVDLETNSDAEIARQLAQAGGIPHRVVAPNRSIEGARYTVRATDLMSQQHSWFADVARARGEEPWWDGIAGDVLSAGLFLEEWNVRLFKERALDELADRLVPPGPVPYFRDHMLFPRDRAVAAVRNELGRHTEAANPVGSFYFWNRTRVNIAASAFGLLQPAGRRTLAPFLDRDLWQFLASIPLQHVVDQRLHDDVIRRAYPEVANIPYSHKRPAERASYRRRAIRMLATLATERPRRENFAAAARLVRSVVMSSHASDVEWIIPSWVYGDTIARLMR